MIAIICCRITVLKSHILLLTFKNSNTEAESVPKMVNFDWTDLKTGHHDFGCVKNQFSTVVQCLTQSQVLTKALIIYTLNYQPYVHPMH